MISIHPNLPSVNDNLLILRSCKAVMGVGTDTIEHSTNNQVLIDGARRCGFECKDIPQNTGGKKHTACGSFCTFGCCIGVKQGTAVTWLAEAERKGAVCIKECRVCSHPALEQTRGLLTEIGE